MRKLQILTVVAVVLLTAYPVTELTRIIIEYMIIRELGTEPLQVYFMELWLIITFYLAMPWLLWKCLGLMGHMGRAEGRTGK